MEVRILGPTEAIVAGNPAPLAGSKQRAVLVMLALEAPRAVPASRLAEGLWGEAPPASAAKMVQVYVSQLRKALTNGASPIVTQGRGYELRMPPDALDAHRFERLVGEATRAAELGAPSDTARTALALWRGPPLLDVAGEPFAGAEIRRLEDLRLTALELELDADLRAGRHGEILGRLDQLIAAHPLRERLHAQRMLALYRVGRQADALAAFRVARRVLVEEIGAEPGPELRRLHDAVLRQDRGLEPVLTTLPPELEAGTTLLAGRGAELAWLAEAWREAHAGTGRLVLLSGPAGIGKTRLIAALADGVRRQGAPVHYVGADSPAAAPRAALTAALTARRPALAVLDDLDRLGEDAFDALHDAQLRLRGHRTLVVGAGRDQRLVARAGAVTPRRIGPLAGDDVERIARLYDATADVPVAELLAVSDGVPLRVHQAAASWARDVAAERVEVVAAQAASRRRNLRAVESELAGTVVDLQVVRERMHRHAPRREDGGCPFKGLAPFERADAALFFGRDRLVAELVARLVGTPLLALVGPSGSGKSSVLRAGLLPELASGVLPGSTRWTQVLLRPGPDPAGELDRALGGVDRALAATTPERRLVVAVDQFEELFTAGAPAAARAEFVAALVRLAADPARAFVVLAIRADFYGRCSAYPELAHLLGAGHVLVGAMRRDELRRAIELPAERAGLTAEPALVEALLDDVGDAPGGLPLLSAALLELWQQREGRTLRLAGYRQLGGVKGAVARLAEAAYDQLEDDQRPIARAALLRMAAGDAGTAVRRRVPRAEFDPDAEPVLAVLAQQRLLSVDAATVEVAHETLLRAWPRLAGWLAEDADDRRVHAYLIDAAGAWEAGGRDGVDLYRGARLAAASEWADRQPERLNAVERAFLAESRAAGRREVEHARRSVRRLRASLAGVALLMVAAVAGGLVALAQRGRARDATTSAEAQRLGAVALTEDRLDRALLLARQGMALAPSTASAGNLLATLVRSPAAIAIHHGTGNRLLALGLAPDGRTLAVGDNQGQLMFLDPATGAGLAPQYDAGVTIVDLAFARDGRSVLIAGQGNHGALLRVVGVRDSSRARDLAVPDSAPLHVVAFSPGGREALAGWTEETPNGLGPSWVGRYDVATGRALGRPVKTSDGFMASMLAFRPGTRQLVTVDQKTTTVRDGRTLRPLRVLRGGGFAASLAADGRHVALGREDGSVELLDLVTGATRTASGRHAAKVQEMAFARDGRTLVTTGDDQRVIVWDVQRAALRETLEGHGGRVPAIALARDGRTLYSASLDKSVIVWDLDGDRRLGRPFPVGPERPSAGFAVSPDGASLAVGQADGRVSLIDTADPRRRRTVGTAKGYPSVAFAGGDRVVAADERGGLQVWDVSTGRAVTRRVQAHRDVIWTPQVSADGRLLGTASADGTVRLWRLPSLAPVREAMRFPVIPEDAALSPDGAQLAVPREDGLLDVFRTRDRRRVARVRADPDSLVLGRWAPDGRSFVTGGVDGVVRFWSRASWRPSGRPLDAHAGFVTSLGFDRAGKRLVSGGSDGKVRLWDIATRTPIGTSLPGFDNRWVAAAFASGDGRLIAMDESRALRWDIRPAAWARRACQVAGRRLTRAEWAQFLPARAYAPAC